MKIKDRKGCWYTGIGWSHNEKDAMEYITPPAIITCGSDTAELNHDRNYYITEDPHPIASAI